MALYPTYATLSELKAHLVIGDANDDTDLNSKLESASRAIDTATRRQFGQSVAATQRYYSGDNAVLIEGRCAMPVFDISATSDLAVATDLDGDGVYETTLTYGTDFDLWPWNAQPDERPWTHIVLRPGSSSVFPWEARSIRVTALWGWAAVPAVVRDACLIQAARWFARRGSTYGVAGSPDLGNELRLLAKLDADVDVMLSTVRRRFGAWS